MFNPFTISIIFLVLKLSLEKIRIDSKTRLFIDEHNRSIIFHGLNIVVKIPPYIPNTDKFDPYWSLTNQDIEYMKKFGFNLVRLGIIWESVERSPGVYDYEYLEKMDNLIHKLGENDIMVVIDAHQDLFSRTLCGEGVPTFYAKKLNIKRNCNDNFVSRVLGYFGLCLNWRDLNTRNETTKEFTNPPQDIEYDSNGIPKIEDCIRRSFIDMHMIPEVSSVYSEFYSNSNNIMDNFIKFWKVVANKFKGNPYVIAYDIWNEPWSGNLFSSFWGAYPGENDKSFLLPFYKKVDKELRQVDNEYTMMFSPSVTDNIPFLGGFYFHGFTESPAGDDYKSNQIISEHVYCIQSDANFMKNTTHPVHFNRKCKTFFDYKLRKFKLLANKLGLVPFIGEFGACKNNLACYYEINNLVSICDQHLMSWAYWNYKPFGDHTTHADDEEGLFNPDGTTQDLKLKALVRPYIKKFQGQALVNRYNSENKLLFSKFRLDLNISKETEVFFNGNLTFPNGYKYIIIPYEEVNKKQQETNFIKELNLIVNKQEYGLNFLIQNKHREMYNPNKYVISLLLTEKINTTIKFINKKILEHPLGKKLEPSEMIETIIEDLDVTSSYGNIIEVTTTNPSILNEINSYFVNVQYHTKPEKLKKTSCNIGHKCFVNNVFTDSIKVRVFQKNSKSKKKFKVIKLIFKNALKNFIRIYIK